MVKKCCVYTCYLTYLSTERMVIVGVLLGTFNNYYYKRLDKLLPKSDLKTVLIKVVADQILASPNIILIFFYGSGILEGKTGSQVTEEVMDKFKYVYLGDCLFWPPVQFVNFYLLPAQFRVFYINLAMMVYDSFLSFMKHGFEH